MRLIIDGFNKSITKRDNQIVIKEEGKEVDCFLPKDLKQIIILGKGAITFDAIALLAESDVDLIAIDWRGISDIVLHQKITITFTLENSSINH